MIYDLLKAIYDLFQVFMNDINDIMNDINDIMKDIGDSHYSRKADETALLKTEAEFYWI